MNFSDIIKIPALIATLSLSCAQSVMADQNEFSFALIGDVPYKVSPGQDYPPFDNLIKDVNEEEDLKWVLHAGDIKSGSTPCSDALFEDRLIRYNKFDIPFVLTPGDNGWTDCHRVSAGEFQPLERLARFREIFYAKPGYTIGGTTMQVSTQADIIGYEEFPENVRWVEQGVIFATLHVVGSENGLRDFDPASSAKRTIADDEEVVRRTQAVLNWIDTTFELAKSEHAAGVFLLMQANPGLERRPGKHTGFEAILANIESHVKQYNKPVVLAHGDSHYFREDKPALPGGAFLPNFTRVETFGASRVHWIKVTVEPDSTQVFKIQQKIVKKNM